MRVRRPQKLLLAIVGSVAAAYLLGATLPPFLVDAERLRPQADERLSVPLQVRGTIHDPAIQPDLDKVLSEGVLRALKKEGTKSLLKRLLGR